MAEPWAKKVEAEKRAKREAEAAEREIRREQERQAAAAKAAEEARIRAEEEAKLAAARKVAEEAAIAARRAEEEAAIAARRAEDQRRAERQLEESRLRAMKEHAEREKQRQWLLHGRDWLLEALGKPSTWRSDKTFPDGRMIFAWRVDHHQKPGIKELSLQEVQSLYQERFRDTQSRLWLSLRSVGMLKDLHSYFAYRDVAALERVKTGLRQEPQEVIDAYNNLVKTEASKDIFTAAVDAVYHELVAPQMAAAIKRHLAKAHNPRADEWQQHQRRQQQNSASPRQEPPQIDRSGPTMSP